nr:hypothetical protein [Tanacetum cinerariifolium]
MSMSDQSLANGKTLKRSHFGEFKVRKPKVAKKPIRGKSVEDEEIASFCRACLVEKWMEMKANEKEVMARHMPPTLPEFGNKELLNNDRLFFSSGSSSSESSFGWHSEVEVVKPNPSCFVPLKRPKHVKTSVSLLSAMKMQNEVQMFDDDQINTNDHSGLIRSKTHALKINASLKKKNSIFSLTLLDEIYRSINGGDEKFGEFKVRKPKVAKKPIRGKSVEDEEIASFGRACLVEKWMEMKANEKEVLELLNNDPLFFSSGLSSSDFSFGWHSEVEV